ncbi:MAG: hypothetical protein WD014_04750 [Dongiaceae bacterium]
MTLGLYEGRVRRRRRIRVAVAEGLVALSLIVAAGLVAYQSGSTLAGREEARLRQEAARLTEENAALQRRNAELQSAAAAAAAEAGTWRQRYEREAATGDVKALLDLAQRKLAAGVEPARLAFVIEAAQNDAACDETPVTKRFIVKTALSGGANDAVGFADNAITVTAEGRAATDAAGKPEAWFDPAQPVTLRFARLGGGVSEVSGALPLHHSLAIAGAEYRFTVVAGARGFAAVTGDRCRFP